MDQGRATIGGAAEKTGIAGVLARLRESDGAAGHAWCRHLAAPGAQQRDLGDALHALCSLHGHQPGMADAVRDHRPIPTASEWLDAVADGFAAERGYLAHLAAAAGPLPSTPGHAESQAAIAHQRRALEMLACSDRGGCAIGALAALVEDWLPIRRILDVAASRYGIAAPICALPTPERTNAAVAQVATSVGIERAVGFGAQQLLAQHRGLWSLLEARAEARDRS